MKKELYPSIYMSVIFIYCCKYRFLIITFHFINKRKNNRLNKIIRVILVLTYISFSKIYMVCSL